MLMRVLTIVAVLQLSFIQSQAETDTRNVDAKDAVTIDGRLYYFGLFQANILETIDFCDSISMTLLSLETDEEGKAVSNFLIYNETLRMDTYWTGAMFLTNKWMWNGSGRMINEASTLWSTDRPVATNATRQACAYLRRSGRAYYLYDDPDCSMWSYHVACEQRNC